MRSSSLLTRCFAAFAALAATATASASAADSPAQSSNVLASTFTPPQVFKNANLVRTTNLDKAYAREVINVVVENIDKKPHDEYYLPFDAAHMAHVGALEARDKKNAAAPPLTVAIVAMDPHSATHYYRIRLPEPLAPGAQYTLSISYAVLSELAPVPATLAQTDKQYVQYAFSAYAPAAYPTDKQRTKVKFPNTDIADYAKLPNDLNADAAHDPQKQGSTLTYGLYTNVPAGAHYPVTVRYEFTKPITHATLLERDLEVSHWGGNLAAEERYWLVNQGATLKNHFSRVEWQKQSYMNPATYALKGLQLPLAPGALDPYFIDDIGNVSTSRFRPGKKENLLELKPRYPVFGSWKYSFRVGWNANLSTYLRKLAHGDTYVLRVPFLEGPRAAEGIAYGRVVLRVILPEGATNVKFSTTVPLADNTTGLHHTFMDTLGRTSLTLTALNLVDDMRDRDLILTYDYPWTAGYRKPVVITFAAFALFAVVWALGSIDTSIGKKKTA